MTTRWLARFKGPIVAIAGVGAVLSGLVGWYTTYKTVAGTQLAASEATSAAKLSDAGPLSILVLPLANQTGDAAKAYIADALTSSITADLSRIRDAFVAPMANAFAFKDKQMTVQQVGREAGVRFVLQGSVATSGDRLRLSAQLADARSGALVWSDTLEGPMTNLFALQDQITNGVSYAISRELVVIAARESEKRPSSSKVADLTLRARALSTRPSSLENFGQIEALYRQVLALDPQDSRAMISLAQVLVLSANNYGTSLDPELRERKFVEARALALKAEASNPGDVGILIVLAYYAHTHDDFEGALRTQERIVALKPKAGFAYNNLADALLRGGDPQRALEVVQKGIALDPQHVTDVQSINTGKAYLQLGNYPLAIEWLEKARALSPNYYNPYAYLAVAYELNGEPVKAQAVAAELRRIAPSYSRKAIAQPSPNSPQRFKDFWQKIFVPAWDKAGLPE